MNFLRRYWLWVVIALLVVAGIAWSKRSQPAVAAAMQTAPVTRGSLIQSITSTGTLSALTEVTVGSQVSGIVTKVLVDFNDHVKQGQPIAIIDPQTLQAQVDSARANVHVKQVAHDEALRQYAEGQRIAAQKYIAESDLRTLEAAVKSTKAQLEAATVDFNKQSVQLNFAVIRAPIDGVVMSRTVDPGNTVAASLQAPTLFVIASDLKKLKILANVDETQIPQITPGMSATFTVSGLEGRSFKAVVDQVRLKPTTISNVVTYTVVLHAENPDQVLYPGMTATIGFVSAELHDALLVSAAALRVRVPDELRVPEDRRAAAGGPGEKSSAAPPMPQPVGKRPTVLWRVNAQGLAHRVRVKVLASDLTNTAVQVLGDDELNVGDAVVTKVNDAFASSSRSSNPMMFGPPGGGR